MATANCFGSLNKYNVMILSFVAIDPDREFRDFSCQIFNLEDALDVLSIVVSKGSLLISAQVIDEGSHTELPVEVFDGQSFSDSLRKLKKQWEAVLKKPVRSTLPDHSWQIELTHQQLRIYEDRIVQLTWMINTFEQFRERTYRAVYQPRKANLIKYYDSSLNNYQRYVDRAKLGQRIALEKLNKLQA